ncbi:corrinoid protein [Clostridia bacterium]|nr:corrinoid protein [Clostridia bacterium]
MLDYEELQEALIEGDEEELLDQVEDLLEQGASPVAIIADGMMEAMAIVGDRFGSGEMYVPEVLMCANAMNMAVDRLKPLLEGEKIESKGKIVLGTVKGDLHDIGKNLVAMFLEASGFEVLDLGVDVSPESFVNEAKNGAQIIGMSALVTTTMKVMSEVVKKLDSEGLRDSVHVIVGGAPLSQEYADEIGADGFSKDAASAARLCAGLLA